MFNWQQVVATSGLVIAGYVVTHIKTAARAEKVSEDHEERLDDHETRLDRHDEKFEKLDERFVPRQENQVTLNAIRDSQDRTERYLERLILGRVPPIVGKEEER